MELEWAGKDHPSKVSGSTRIHTPILLPLSDYRRDRSNARQAHLRLRYSCREPSHTHRPDITRNARNPQGVRRGCGEVCTDMPYTLFPPSCTY